VQGRKQSDIWWRNVEIHGMRLATGVSAELYGPC
jgi:hypothetical protein